MSIETKRIVFNAIIKELEMFMIQISIDCDFISFSKNQIDDFIHENLQLISELTNEIIVEYAQDGELALLFTDEIYSRVRKYMGPLFDKIIYIS